MSCFKCMPVGDFQECSVKLSFFFFPLCFARVTKLVWTKLNTNSILAETSYTEIRLKTDSFWTSYKSWKKSMIIVERMTQT